MNEEFRAQLEINEDKIIISGIMNLDGTVAIQGENKVAVTLLNIEREPFAKISNTVSQSNGVSSGNGNTISLNLFIMFAAYFSSNNYTEALNFLDYVINYLQQKNVFTRQNTPDLPSGVEKLVLEIENINTERLNNIWSTIGAKYLPSVIYKMRMITYVSKAIKEMRPVISQVNH